MSLYCFAILRGLRQCEQLLSLLFFGSIFLCVPRVLCGEFFPEGHLHSQPSSEGFTGNGTSWFRPVAKLSILVAAPRRTILPTQMASAISCSSQPLPSALAKLACKQDWQLAVIEALTAIKRIVRSSSCISFFSFP